MEKEEFKKALAYRILGYEARPLSTALMFLDNKYKLKEAKDGTQDKFYHARANAQAGQIYDIPTALAISYGREIWDLIRKNTTSKPRGAIFKSIWEDSKKDIEADNYGLMQGLLHPFSDVDSILDKKWLYNLNH